MTGNSMSSNLLYSSPILNTGAGGIPPAPPVRITQESLNMLINTCSDLVTNMSNLQKKMVSNEAREQERLNQLWANLSNAAQGKVPNSQGAPPSQGLPQTLLMQQSSQPRQPVPAMPQPTVTDLRGMLGLQEQAAAIQAALQQDTNNTVLQGSCNKQALKSGRDRVGG